MCGHRLFGCRRLPLSRLDQERTRDCENLAVARKHSRSGVLFPAGDLDRPRDYDVLLARHDRSVDPPSEPCEHAQR